MEKVTEKMNKGNSGKEGRSESKWNISGRVKTERKGCNIQCLDLPSQSPPVK
jgi:hypothetical protein